MRVAFSDSFAEKFLYFDNDMRDIIMDFVMYVEKHGLKGLAGRNKSSVLVDMSTHPSFILPSLDNWKI